MQTPINNSYVALKPIIHPWIRTLLEMSENVFEVVSTHGSPVHLHAEKPFEENIMRFVDMFCKHQIEGRIFYARKANKCLSFAELCNRMGQGVDTASFKELKQCLDAGISPRNIIYTAAVKERNALELVVQHGIPVVLDNMDETMFLHELAREENKHVEVQMRVSGFQVGDCRLSSRFGFSIDTAEHDIHYLSKEYPWLVYSGLHFHLNGYDTIQRGEALGQCIDLADRLVRYGLDTKSIDIGGGFLVCYLQERCAWEAFHQELRRALLGEREAITYGNDPLGITLIDNKLYGDPAVYPYFNEKSKDIFLDEILTHVPSSFDNPNYTLLKERSIRLHIEPGRSLLDGAGITVAKVVFRKRDTEGNLLIGLAMNRTNLKSSSADFLLDPIHIPRLGYSMEKQVCQGYLVGSYCLEQEFLLKRKVRFNHYPEIGDLFIFVNTAGYMMHFMESEGHLFGTPQNIFYDADLTTFTKDMEK